MKLTTNFQTYPHGFWVTAEFSNGSLTLRHSYSLEDELDLHKDNIKNGLYSEKSLVTAYMETEQDCKKYSVMRFEDEGECADWLMEHKTEEDIYWSELEE